MTAHFTNFESHKKSASHAEALTKPAVKVVIVKKSDDDNNTKKETLESKQKIIEKQTYSDNCEGGLGGPMCREVARLKDPIYCDIKPDLLLC